MLLDDADEGTSVVIADGAEVGADLWLSVTYIREQADGQESGRIMRWSDGQWSVMANRGDGIGGALAVDAQGGVWAAGIDGCHRWCSVEAQQVGRIHVDRSGL